MSMSEIIVQLKERGKCTTTAPYFSQEVKSNFLATHQARKKSLEDPKFYLGLTILKKKKRNYFYILFVEQLYKVSLWKGGGEEK